MKIDIRPRSANSAKRRYNNVKSQGGFTLMELMVSIVIVGITTAIALPSYRDSVLKTNRSDAQITTASMATLEERYYFTHNRYTGDFADIVEGADPGDPILSEKQHYSIALSVSADGREWTMEATAIDGQAQDHNCAKMAVTSKGTKVSYDSNDAVSTDCWK